MTGSAIDPLLAGITQEAARIIVEQGIEDFRIDEGAGALYHFFWDELCDWYLELIKPRLRNPDEAPVARQVDGVDRPALGELRLVEEPVVEVPAEAVQQHQRRRVSFSHGEIANRPTRDLEHLGLRPRHAFGLPRREHLGEAGYETRAYHAGLGIPTVDQEPASLHAPTVTIVGCQCDAWAEFVVRS